MNAWDATEWAWLICLCVSYCDEILPKVTNQMPLASIVGTCSLQVAERFEELETPRSSIIDQLAGTPAAGSLPDLRVRYSPDPERAYYHVVFHYKIHPSSPTEARRRLGEEVSPRSCIHTSIFPTLCPAGRG